MIDVINKACALSASESRPEDVEAHRERGVRHEKHSFLATLIYLYTTVEQPTLIR